MIYHNMNNDGNLTKPPFIGIQVKVNSTISNVVTQHVGLPRGMARYQHDLFDGILWIQES
jgi:hypothetical protein